jgi:hypothetical protein
MSDCSRSVFLLSGSVTIMTRTFFVFRLHHPLLVSICCLKNVLALGCFRRYFLFRLPETISSAIVSAPYEKQFLVWMVMLVDCMLLFMVGAPNLMSFSMCSTIPFQRLDLPCSTPAALSRGRHRHCHVHARGVSLPLDISRQFPLA